MKTFGLLCIALLALACTGEPRAIGRAPGLGATCEDTDDCGGQTTLCVGGFCVACRTAADCNTGLRCTAGGLCVLCEADMDCAAGARCLGNQCVATCSATTPCDEEGPPVCDTSTGTCVECVSAASCSEERPLCDPSMLACVQCLTEADCDATARMCVAGACAECVQNSDCETDEVCTADLGCESICITAASCTDASKPVCDPVGGVCVECADDTNCMRSVEKPVCVGSVCVECRTNADCPTEEPTCTDNECRSS